jgi:predicted permease
MAGPRTLFRRIRTLWSSEQVHDEIAEEMSFHLEERTAENIRQGMSEEDARREATRRFGPISRLHEEAYKARALVETEALAQDVKFGVRLLYRAPGFSILALACLTIGIGANAAVLSWIEGILLRPYPAVAHQDRMLAIAGTRNGVAGAAGSANPLSWPDFQDLRDGSTLFDAFVVSRIMGTTLNVGDHAEQATGSIVTSNYFSALGITPLLGRGFFPAEDLGRNAHPVVVISYDLWRRRFGADPSIVGRSQMLNGQAHTIVGVAPPGFYGTFVGWAMDFWVPVSMQERFDPTAYKLENRAAPWIEGYVFLRPGVTLGQAQQELSAVASRLEARYPSTNRGHGVRLYPLWRTPFNNAGTLFPTLMMALAVVVFVLLIVCANVSNLLLVRGLARQHEIVVRLALGAERPRLLRQLLTEGLVLGLLAAGAGVTCAHWARDLLLLLLPGGSRMNLPGAIDWRVLAVSLAICLASTLLFGLVPALQASGAAIAPTLKGESGGVLGGSRGGLVRTGLVIVQVALTFVLLVGAGLLITSLQKMLHIDPGFEDSSLLTAWIDFGASGYSPSQVVALQDRIAERVAAFPGVQSAAFARITPFEFRGYSSGPVSVEGSEVPPERLPVIDYNEVGPGYLATMGIPLISGREFTRADDESSQPVAVINQAMAEELWPGQDAAGRRIQLRGRWLEVVGVARSAKYRSLVEPSQPFFYLPVRQSLPGGILQIRTSAPPDEILRLLTQETHSLDQSLAPGLVRRMRSQIERTTGPQQAALRMMTAFAGLALLLAAVGLYGVMAFTVAQSSRELGLRVTLGAAPAALLRFTMLRSLRLTLAGVLAGMALALPSSHLLGDLLFHVSSHDPTAFGSAFLLVLVSAVLASLTPAWRASRSDPLRALRS